MRKILISLIVVVALLTASLVAMLLLDSDLVPGRMEYTEPETAQETTEPPAEAAHIHPSTEPPTAAEEQPQGFDWEYADVGHLPLHPRSSGTYYYISGYRDFTDATQTVETVYYLALQSTETNKLYLFDATDTTIPRDFHLYVNTAVIQLTFGEDGSDSWSVHDKAKDENVGAMTSEEMFTYFCHPDAEMIEAGDMPDIFYLSNYEPGKVYVFDNKGQNGSEFLYPRFINDTDTNCLQVGRRTNPNIPFDWDFVFSKNLQNKSVIRIGDTNEEKVYIIVNPAKPDFLVRTYCMKASEYEKEKEIICTREFFQNDTDSDLRITFVYFFKGIERTEDYILAPNEIIDCVQQYNVIIH